MDRPPNLDESVNLVDQGLLASNPYLSIKSESHAPVEPNETLLRILLTFFLSIYRPNLSSN